MPGGGALAAWVTWQTTTLYCVLVRSSDPWFSSTSPRGLVFLRSRDDYSPEPPHQHARARASPGPSSVPPVLRDGDRAARVPPQRARRLARCRLGPLSVPCHTDSGMPPGLSLCTHGAVGYPHTMYYPHTCLTTPTTARSARASRPPCLSF